MKKVPMKVVGKRLGVAKSRIVERELLKINRDVTLIQPREVVKRAEAKSHPLHPFFEWNDATCGDRYREQQARQLIAMVVGVPEGYDDATPVRLFVNVISVSTDPLAGPQGYLPVAEVSQRPCYRSQVLEYAKQQLRLWRHKFGAFEEFNAIVDAIDGLDE